MNISKSPVDLVDPELRPMLDAFPTVSVNADILPFMRQRPPWTEVNPADRARAVMEERCVPGPPAAPEVPIRIYRPVDVPTDLPCVLHIHGGGFVAGSASSMEGIHLPLAADLQCCIVSVDYRLAPETAFPGAVEDCYAALGWVMANAASLGIDTTRLGVMGESAGGGLAAALALLVRDRGEHGLSFQHLIYPMLDDRTCTAADPHPHTGHFIWTAESNRFGWTSLLGGAPGGADVSCYAAPSRASDLSGLPPTFIATGALDLFLEEDLDYARRLMRAGVPVELHVYPGAFHAFNAWPTASVAAQARHDSVRALSAALRQRRD